MKPSLPRRCFDLCIVPRHDGLAPDAHTLVTEGALNRIRPAARATLLGDGRDLKEVVRRETREQWAIKQGYAGPYEGMFTDERGVNVSNLGAVASLQALTLDWSPLAQRLVRAQSLSLLQEFS